MSDSNKSFDDVSVAAVLAQRNREDHNALIDDLVTMLCAVIPGVDVRRALLRRHITSVRIPLGDYAYVLTRASGGSFEPSRQKIVRGVAIKTEPMEIGAFLEELGLALDVELKRTAQGRDALRQWLTSSN